MRVGTEEWEEGGFRSVGGISPFIQDHALGIALILGRWEAAVYRIHFFQYLARLEDIS